MQAVHVKAPGTAGGAAVQAQESTEDLIVVSPVEKLKAALMARAASAGIGVYESFGGYVVGRGSHRELPDLRALQIYLGSMGVRA